MAGMRQFSKIFELYEDQAVGRKYVYIVTQHSDRRFFCHDKVLMRGDVPDEE